MQMIAEAEETPQATAFRAQLVLLWSGPVVAAVLLAMFVAFPGFFPPMSPTRSRACCFPGSPIWRKSPAA